MPRKFDFISPGIEITEVDQSILPAEVDDDGPIIIGRTAKGPAMKPVKVRSLEDYISVYGLPVAGGNSKTGDVWRDGAGSTAPTYASYAAQTWLASQTSPVTMVRLVGEDSDNAATDAAKAGWMLKSSLINSVSKDNSTAYGLFITDYANVGELTFQTITFSGVGEDTKKVVITDSVGPTSVDFVMNAGTSVTENNTTREVVVGASAAATAQVLANKIEEAVSLGLLSGIVVSYDSTDTIVKVATTHLSVPGSLAEDSGGNFAIGGASLAVATQAASSGALAAIFYCNTGSLGLSGKDPSDAAQDGVSCALIKSNAASKGFKLVVKGDGPSIPEEAINFNFDRNSEKYIRKVFNTNPTLTNGTTNSSTKSYWLGETFLRHLETQVTGNVAEQQYGILLPLHENGQNSATAGDAKYNYSYHKEGAAVAQSGWVIANDGNDQSSYDPATSHEKMFKFHSLHEGETIQKETLIAIEDLKLPSNPLVYGYSTFTVRITDINGNTLEKFSNLNMDADSNDFIAKRIGDMNQVWNDADRRYRKEYTFGFLNQSDYVRVEMAPELPQRQNALPFGFLGPGRPKGFGIVKDDKTPKSLDLAADFTGAFVKGGDPSDGSAAGEFADLDSVEAVKFIWPSIPLRVNGSDGFTANPYKAYFGIRPKVSNTSKAYDSDYCDYLRRLPSNYASQQFNPSENFEHSFIFSLDDIVIDANANTVTYTSGSRLNNTSYTATNSTNDLLKKGVSRFMMPLFGGSDGFDIREREPLRFDLVESAKSATDSTNYITYTLNKAIDSVADSEQVPANLMVMPGIKSTTFTDKLIATAESRQDCLAIIDLENDYLPKCEAAAGTSDKDRRGDVESAVTSVKARNFDSSYACAFYPAIQVRDSLNAGKVLWVPSSIAALGAMARTEATSDLWFAPAGFNRGGLGSLGGRSGPVALQATQRLDVSERDDLYAVNINPIASFPNEGLVIFGQKTLQSANSALDRINVRRLMIFLKRKIGDVAKATLFENNVEATWADFRGRAEPILSDVKNRFGLTEYRLILDETTTTPDLIDRNILYAKVFLKPARAIEFIAIDFVITKSGADFV